MLFIVKGLKYLKLHKHMDTLITSLQLVRPAPALGILSCSDACSWGAQGLRLFGAAAIIFFAFLFGFALLSNTIFGTELYEYSSIVKSAKSLLLLLRGQLDYENMITANELFTPLVSAHAGPLPAGTPADRRCWPRRSSSFPFPLSCRSPCPTCSWRSSPTCSSMSRA